MLSKLSHQIKSIAFSKDKEEITQNLLVGMIFNLANNYQAVRKKYLISVEHEA